MKKTIIILAAIIITMSAFAGDIVLTFRIPSSYVQEFREAFFVYLPNSVTMDDPSWVPDPNNLFEEARQIPKYTEKQWVKVKIREWIFACIRKGNIKRRSQLESPVDPNMIQFDDDPNTVE